MGVSINPENFIEGSGLIDDMDVTVEEATFEMFDYNGKSATPAPCLKLNLSGADLEQAVDQFYSMGSAADWAPSDDGKELLAVGKATAIRMSSNGGLLLKSLLDAGFPAEDLGEDISVLNGMEIHVIQTPTPQRNMKKTPEQEAKEKKYGPPTILLISEIITMPGEAKATPKKAAAKKTAAKPKTAAKKATPKKKAAASDDVEADATAAILEILADEGAIAKKDLPAKIFANMKDNPNKNAIVKLVFSDNFLAAGPWTYEDDTVVSN